MAAIPFIECRSHFQFGDREVGASVGGEIVGDARIVIVRGHDPVVGGGVGRVEQFHGVLYDNRESCAWRRFGVSTGEY
ncbi:MAG: hypothetical protein ACTSYB_01850 [Candidatus Helarchaeota archaeon]